jgi:hypothetical protein
MEPMEDLQAMDAIASERGLVLAFRVCEETGEYEPVFLGVERAGIGEREETAMLALTDRNGMSLGRYVMSRRRLDAAIEDAQDSFATDCSSAEQLL